jgi:hypothetical protein
LAAESFGRDVKRVVCKASHDHVSVDYTSCQDGQTVVAVCPYSGRRGATCQVLLSETLDVMAFPKYGQGSAIVVSLLTILSLTRLTVW